jgi:hypothetical protein
VQVGEEEVEASHSPPGEEFQPEDTYIIPNPVLEEEPGRLWVKCRKSQSASGRSLVWAQCLLM